MKNLLNKLIATILAIVVAFTLPSTAAAESTQAYTSQISIKSTAVKKPNRTVIKKLSKGKKSFKVYWRKLNGVTGYQVQYSTSKKFYKSKTKTVTVKGNKNISKTIKKLKSGKKYYIRVRAYNKAKVNGKTKTTYGTWSKVKIIRTNNKNSSNKNNSGSSSKKPTEPTKHDHSNDTGNCGRWFNSHDELYNYWKQWALNQGGGYSGYYNGWECSCGMWSADFIEY